MLYTSFLYPQIPTKLLNTKHVILLKILATTGLPTAVAVHFRVPTQVKRQAGSRLSHPGSNPGSRLPPGIQGGIPPPIQDPRWDPASHLGSKAGSRQSRPRSNLGSRLPPGIQGECFLPPEIQGGIPPVPPRVQPGIPHPTWDPRWNPASHQGSKGGIRIKSVQQS